MLKIQCPYCHYNNSLTDIYAPEEVIGQPVDIIRDSRGHIQSFEGKEQRLHKKVPCPNCKQIFEVQLETEYTTGVQLEPQDSETVYQEEPSEMQKILNIAGLSQAQFGKRYKISAGTIAKWCVENPPPPQYITNLFYQLYQARGYL